MDKGAREEFDSLFPTAQFAAGDRAVIAAGWQARGEYEAERVKGLVEALNAILDEPLIYTGAIEEPMRTCGIGSVKKVLHQALQALAQFNGGGKDE